MTIEEALKELAGAKASKMPWMRIAEILQVARKSQRGGRLTGEFMDQAGRTSGYAPGLLRRLEAARQFLLDLDRDHPNLRATERLGGATAMVFKVEQLKRLYGQAPEKALKLYDDVAAGKVTVRELERQYKVALGALDIFKMDPFGGGMTGLGPDPARPRSPRRMFASPFHASCWDALQTDVTKLSGEGDVRLSCDYKFTHFTPFAVAVGVKAFGIDFIDGFYPAPLEAEPSREKLNRALKDIVFQAPFFRQFWVLVPPGDGKIIIGEELVAVGLDAVGCAELDNGHLIVSKNGTGLMAVQQQRHLAEQVLETGVPKGGQG